MKIKDLVPFRKEREGGLARRDELDPFYQFHRSMDRLFDDFLGDFGRFPMAPFRSAAGGGIAPSMDVSESDTEITVTAELPGMEESDVELLLSSETLTIKGEKKLEREEKEKEYYRSERLYGSFCRSIALPADIDREKATATFKKGVLKVVLPKTVQAQKETKRIDIKKD